jgi:general secretion pathway protein G
MRKAFTLIELLVVIAIIAILAGILFPVFAKARERARRTQCISNERQIGTAVRMYMSDWDEKYPWAWTSDVLSGTTTQLHHPVLPEVMTGYVTDQHVWQCPSDTGETFPYDLDSLIGTTPPIYTFCVSSYNYPGWGWTGPSGLNGPRFLVKRPSLAPLIWETRPWHGNYNRNDTLLTSLGLYNVLYCDGHVSQRTEHQWQFEDMPASVQP